MKKKTCTWLDSNIWGALHIINDQVQACCPRCALLIDKISLDKLSVLDIQKARRDFFEGINNGEIKTCEECPFLIEKEEDDIEVGSIESLILHPYTTCNIHCNYCVLSEEKLKAKLSESQREIFPIIEKFYNDKLFKQKFSIALGGGEPLFINDLDKIARFLNNVEEQTELTLISNSTLTNRIDYVISSLSDTPKLIKTCNTSLDSGTKETYKKLKNRDFFNEVCLNLKKYAENNVFDTMILKYVMMNDNSNISKKDLNGFINFIKELKQITKSKLVIIIDADMKIQKNTKDYFKQDEEFKYHHLSWKQVNAAAYLYYKLSKIATINFVGGRINPERSKTGALDVKKIIKQAKKYEKKSLYFAIIKLVSGCKS
ncbi:MAG: radical SAM protein [Candidatus Gastranaerophilales bacterium]|nr:radical SAM protein [Candidatus Gastranaerophilales bacterium]